MPTCGGPTEAKKADASIQKICDQMKAKVEQKAGENFGVFTAKTYQTQVAAGTVYSIKVNVGGDKYIHIKIFQNLPCNGGELQLMNVQSHKTLSDPIVF